MMNWQKVAGIMFMNDLSYNNPDNDKREIGSIRPPTNMFLPGQEGSVTGLKSVDDATHNLAYGNQNVGFASMTDPTNHAGILPRFQGDTLYYVPPFLGGTAAPLSTSNLLASPKVDIWTSELEYSGLNLD